MTQRQIHKGVSFILFVLAFATSLTINSLVALASTLVPGERE